MLSRKTKGMFGISVDADAVRAVIVEEKKIIWHGSEMLKPGAVVSGQIMEPGQVGEAIRRLVNRSKVKANNVRIAWSPGSLMHRSMPFPEGLRKKEDLRSALLIDADNSFKPLDPKRLYKHVYTIEKTAGVIAAEKTHMAAMVEASKHARIKISSLTPEIVGLSSILQRNEYQYGVIYFGYGLTLYARFIDNTLSYIRPVSVGVSQAVERLEGKFDGNWDEARQALFDSGTEGDFVDILLPWSDEVSQELENTILYADQELGSAAEVIYLAGPGTGIPGLYNQLQSQLPNTCDRAAFDLDWDEVAFHEHALYLGAVIAALAETPYNMVDGDATKVSGQDSAEMLGPRLIIENEKGDRFPLRQALLSTLVAILILVGGWYGLDWGKEQETQQETTKKRALIQAVQDGRIDVTAPPGFKETMGDAYIVWDNEQAMRDQTEFLAQAETIFVDAGNVIASVQYNTEGFAFKGSGSRTVLDTALDKLKANGFAVVGAPKFVGTVWEVRLKHEQS